MSRGRRTSPLGSVPAVPTGWLWQGSCFGGHSPVERGGRACPGWVAAPPGYSRSGAPVPHGGPSHTPLQARPEPRAAWPEKPPCRTGVLGVASGPLFPAKTHRALRRPRGPRTPGPVGPAAVSWKAAVRLSAARPFPCAWPSVPAAGPGVGARRPLAGRGPDDQGRSCVSARPGRGARPFGRTSFRMFPWQCLCVIDTSVLGSERSRWSSLVQGGGSPSRLEA